MRYRQLCFTCATHTANLVVRGAICTGGTDAGDGHPLVAVCVRFFKFLMPDYAVEFSASLRQYVTDNLSFREDRADAATVASWRKLQQLYGSRVIPDQVLELLHGPSSSLQHHIGRSSGSSHTNCEWSVQSQVAQMLENLCLRCEERPVTTRFWLFGDCVDCLFRFVLFGLRPESILQTGVKHPLEGSAKRLRKVCAYLNAPTARLELATASLCLRLTRIATSLTGRTASGRSSGSEPEFMLVQLARGVVSRRTGRELSGILACLVHDELLWPHGGHVVERLLSTQGQIVLRFRKYQCFPTRVALLSRQCNPLTYYSEIVHFLNCSEDALDAGYSLDLRREAWQRGGGVEARAVQFILEERCQRELETIARRIEGVTLEVERKHYYDRRAERRRVDTVSKASRDSFIRVWRAQSKSAYQEQRRQQASEQSSRGRKHLNVVAVACQLQPRLSPQATGKLRWQDAESASPSELRDGRSSGPLRKYIADHVDELKAEVKRLKMSSAQCGRSSGSGEFANSRNSLPSWPLSKQGWVEWCGENSQRFADTLKSIRAGARRRVNDRLVPHRRAPESVPPAATRNRGDAVGKSGCQALWVDRLQNGFYVLRNAGRPDTRFVVFVHLIQVVLRPFLLLTP